MGPCQENSSASFFPSPFPLLPYLLSYTYALYEEGPVSSLTVPWLAWANLAFLPYPSFAHTKERKVEADTNCREAFFLLPSPCCTCTYRQERGGERRKYLSVPWQDFSLLHRRRQEEKKEKIVPRSRDSSFCCTGMVVIETCHREIKEEVGLCKKIAVISSASEAFFLIPTKTPRRGAKGD